MSKLLWKSLLVSPAVLGVTLLVSGSAVRAADSASLLTIDSQVSTQVAQPQTAEVQTPEVQSTAKNTSASRFNNTKPGLLGSEIASLQATPTNPAAQDTQVFSTAATQATAKQTSAEVTQPAEVSVVPNQLTPATPTTEASAVQPVMPTEKTTVAQVTPGQSDSDVLNQIDRYSREGNSNSQDQVTNVSQFTDVSPGDWAYEALRSLVERYGCIVGYPDSTYRGNRALSRYEFAAGLNACLNQVERLISESTADFVRREDLEVLRRLIEEFRTELTALRGRVDNLEGRVNFLEEHQFSTTTKLVGEAIFAATDTFGDENVTANLGNLIPGAGIVAIDNDNNTIFGDRVRLEFNTSFTGQDRLVTRLAAGNLSAFTPNSPNIPGFGALNTAEGTQTFNLTGGSVNNDIVLDWLAYYFNFGSSRVYVAATGGIHSDYAPTLNPYFEDYDGGNGALSTFASESPIYRIGGGAGAALSLGVGPLESILGPSTLTVGYLAGPSANDPSEKNGLFDGDYAALAQLNFNIGDRIGIGATYVHGYHNAGSDIFDLGGGNNGAVVGTFFANNPSESVFLASGGLLPVTPVVTNSYGVEAAFRLTDNISISGFGSYTDAILVGQGGAEIWSYGAGIAFSDLGKEGNVLGIFGGAQPYLGSADTQVVDLRQGDDDRPYHIEAFYKYQVTDNISITPGVIWLTAPNQIASEDAFIGTLRTTFKF